MILIIGHKNPSRVSLMITLIVKKETSSSLKMELNIKVNGKTVSGTVKVFKFGLMEQSTKVTGKITESTAKVLNSTLWMNQISRAHFAKVKNKDLVRKSGQMAAHTVVIGA